MVEKNERKVDMWLDTKVEPLDEFQNTEYQKLLEYAKQNEMNLLSLLVNNFTDELKRGCMFGTSKLKYFEGGISEDERLLTAFKLGELYGTIGCIGRIHYEEQENQLAMAKFQYVVKLLPLLKKQMEEIVIYLHNSGGINEKQLLNVVEVKLLDLMEILHRLKVAGIIDERGTSKNTLYSLSDAGIRVAKQMKKDN